MAYDKFNLEIRVLLEKPQGQRRIVEMNVTVIACSRARRTLTVYDTGKPWLSGNDLRGS